jgi:hypothetical protein
VVGGADVGGPDEPLFTVDLELDLDDQRVGRGRPAEPQHEVGHERALGQLGGLELGAGVGVEAGQRRLGEADRQRGRVLDEVDDGLVQHAGHGGLRAGLSKGRATGRHSSRIDDDV